jgi:hypothetical protein
MYRYTSLALLYLEKIKLIDFTKLVKPSFPIMTFEAAFAGEISYGQNMSDPRESGFPSPAP